MPTPKLESRPSTRAVKKSSLSQEKIMVGLSACFFGGILLYTFIPEGPLRGSIIGVLSCLMLYVLFCGNPFASKRA
jgi:hypothetical protein